MSCLVKRNKVNNIVKVSAPNGADSFLFQTINNLFIPSKEKALRFWAQVYTPSFKSWFGRDWESTPRNRKNQDFNREPLLKLDKDKPYFVNDKGEQLPLVANPAVKARLKAQRQKKLNKTSQDNIVAISNQLARQYGLEINYVNDPSLEWAGKLDKGTPTINLAKADATTAVHEISHLPVRILRTDNKELFDNLWDQVDTAMPNLIEQIANDRPDLSEDALKEEQIVEALAVLARDEINKFPTSKLKIMYNRVVQFLRDLLGRSVRKDIDLKFLSPDTTLAALASAIIDQESLIDISEADVLDDILYKKKEVKPEEEKESLINKIKALGDNLGLSLDESNAEDTFYYAEGIPRLERLTQFVSDTFSVKYKIYNKETKSYEEKQYSIAEYKAYNDFKKAGKPFTDTITLENGNLVLNFKQYIAYLDRKFDADRKYGTYFHKHMEMLLERDAKKKQVLKAELVKISKEKEAIDGKPINAKQIKWIEDSLQDILNKAGIKYISDPNSKVTLEKEDKFGAEVLVHSELLGIASTVDGIVEHSNGTLSIVDWKTGRLTSDAMSSAVLRYGRKHLLTDSKLTKAKLEVMLRALMVKEHMPDTRFRDLMISNINKETTSTVHRVDVEAYLGTIAEYLKAEKPEVYKFYMEKGLLDHLNYMADSRIMDDFYNRMEDMDRDQQEEYIEQELNGIFAVHTNEEVQNIPALRKKVAKLTRIKLELAKSPNVRLEDMIENVGFVRSYLDNLWDAKSPTIQVYAKLVNDKRIKARQAIKDLEREEERMFQPVLEEYLAENPTAGTLDSLTRGNIKGVSFLGLKAGLNTKDLYAFMWEESTQDHNPGLHANRSDTYIDRKGKLRKLSDAQREYRDWYHKEMQTQWANTMHEKITVKEGNDYYQRSKAAAMNYNLNLEADFMPRAAIHPDEISDQEQGWAANMIDRAAFWKAKNLTHFIAASFQGATQNGVAVKNYVKPGSEIIAQRNHTLDARESFRKFTRGLIQKREMDELYSLGKGLKTYLQLKADEAGTPGIKHTIDFIEGQVMTHVQGIKPGQQISQSKMRITSRNKEGTLVYKDIQFDKVMLSLKNFVSMTTMALRPVRGVANGVLIFTLNAIEGTKGTLAQIVNVDPKDIDFTLTDLIASQTEYFKQIGNFMIQSKTKTKLQSLAEDMDYLTDNYDYVVSQSNLSSAKNKLWDTSNLFVFHGVLENYGAMMMMAAQLKGIKVKTKDGKMVSMYDLYKKDSVTGKYEYKGPSRGKIKTENGVVEDLFGLHPLEIKKMKRVSERVHGSYRHEERVNAELHVLGQWLLQFKKYYPMMVKNLINGGKQDGALGSWVIEKDANGNPTVDKESGESIYVWEKRMTIGRARLLIDMATNKVGKFTNEDGSLRSDEYDWNNMPEGYKQELRHFLAMGAWVAIILLSQAVGFDDDDEDKFYYNLISKLAEDITQGVNPMDLLKPIEKPTAVIPKIIKLNQAVTDYLTKGVWEGRVTRDGSPVGRNRVISQLPIGIGYSTMKRFYDTLDDTDKSYLGFMGLGR